MRHRSLGSRRSWILAPLALASLALLAPGASLAKKGAPGAGHAKKGAPGVAHAKKGALGVAHAKQAKAASHAGGPGGLRAGACARVITPVVGANHGDPIFMAGFDNDRQATGVHDDLWARGIVLESDGTKIAIVTLDLIGYFNNEIQTIRSLVDPERGFDSITVTSTHDHEGPDTMGLWGPDQTSSGADLDYLDFVNEQVAGCIHDADDALASAEIKFATGSTAGASLPPWTDLVADGHVLEELDVDLSLMGGQGVVHVEGDPGPIINASVPTLQIRRRPSPGEHARAVLAWVFGGGPRPPRGPDRSVIATLVNYASHPESLGADNTLITSDFPHYTREALEARYGGVAIYMSADLGVLQGPLDVDVADASGAQVPRRTFAFAERMGELLAERAIRALDGTKRWHKKPRIETISSPLLVGVENPFFVALSQFGVFGRRTPLQDSTGQFVVESELQVLRIGHAQFVVTPNELDPQIGDHYRSLMTTARHRFVAGLGNDEIGYQMPAAKFNPSCFECFIFVLFGDEDDCPLRDTLDCGTVFINNIGPGADEQFQPLFEEMLDELN
jgi:hypothetical protein